MRTALVGLACSAGMFTRCTFASGINCGAAAAAADVLAVAGVDEGGDGCLVEVDGGCAGAGAGAGGAGVGAGAGAGVGTGAVAGAAAGAVAGAGAGVVGVDGIVAATGLAAVCIHNTNSSQTQRKECKWNHKCHGSEQTYLGGCYACKLRFESRH